MANPVLKGYTKTRNHLKTLRKTTICWNQTNSKYKNTSYVGTRFLHLACQGGRFVSYATDQVHHPQVLLIESHVAIGMIQQTQDAASVLWVYRHNKWHAAWPTLILRFMETRWKTLALSPRKLNKTKFRE